MTAAQYFVTIISSLLAMVCIVLLLLAYFRSNELVTPWTLFLLMAIVDFYMPAALFFPVGLDLPPYLSLLARDVVLPAVLCFTIGAAFFAWGYHSADAVPLARRRGAELPASKPRVLLLVAAAGGLFLLGIVSAIVHAGGVTQYFSERLVNRFAQPAADQDALTSLLAGIEGTLRFAILAAAGVAFTRRDSWRILGYALPVFAGLVCATTLLRGSMLAVVMGLAIVERARLHDRETVRGGGQIARANLRVVLLCAAGIVVFVAFGAARNYFTQQAYSSQATVSSSVSFEAARFVRGEGFVGLLAIMDAYPRDIAYMGGRTIIDMLLLPVPRALWPDKPLWYGIDDITRAMGWPTTSQSAVTMQGELFANFSWWGLPLMWVYGWMFGSARAMRYHPLLRYVYAFSLVPMMVPTFWMAFSGFVNGLVPVPLMLLSIWFMFPRRRIATADATVPVLG